MMKFGLQKKMVFGMLIVSGVTYATSGFFIFVLKPYLAPNMGDLAYDAIIFMLGIFWTCLLGWLAASLIVKPLIQLTKAADEAAQGRLSVTLPTYRFHDEVRVLTDSFGKMIRNLQGMIAEIKSSVDISTRNTSMLGDAMTHAAEQIEHISRTAEDMNHGAEQQAVWTAQSAASVEEIHASAVAVRERASETERMTANMLDTLAESEDILKSIMDGMLRAAEAGQASIDTVQRLNEQAEQIGDISIAVREIADQTHLLALNASIEAARAGEQGAGFAVIASQVRKLAEQSAAAVSNINERIVQMQSQVVEAVGLITAQVETVSLEAGKKDDAARALNTIAEVTKQASTAVHDIATSVGQQTERFATTLQQTRKMAAVVNEMALGTRQVASATQEQTAVMEEMAASSDVLRDQAGRLKAQIEAFKC
ncbi:methyl-accepting chemotaxis protein [Paenibacillus apiarius]|uniref:Methyl-accepting chemotaxis protein n=1 Tax=Paenibacillus apiarius TaxID=46240 RepID=A0ABT4DPZ4_9BACL|nr:methyl-accepting chemotaxis protein [Paenibacillus apiarius]MCY9515622.1 methyl-accepting chemotaxis protein [Paenibacillus apiarius]MCY9519305.1 methyl-accepting chemotaxis protein [Paenibacillus apiarius]MCY9550941.1 methyl-accepting chemotaxis protein [Paenibacillus apiarius]MCY9558967.1 methyl-accepting chemotaxis protein [Paenibacillus apiarius]MCY9683556.1 methyl-accepting chemotaxis protein [Paenibacillus apiarius]